MNDHTKRVRMSDKLKSAQFDHQPPMIVWRCSHRPRRRVLRVFLTRTCWHVVDDRFRVPTDDWFRLSGLNYTAADVQKGAVLGGRKVRGVDEELDLDISQWSAPERPFAVGCSCKASPAIKAPLEWLAEDCRRARDERRRVERIIE